MLTYLVPSGNRTMGDRYFSFALLSGSKMGLESLGRRTDSNFGQWGQWVGFIALATEFK